MSHAGLKTALRGKPQMRPSSATLRLLLCALFASSLAAAEETTPDAGRDTNAIAMVARAVSDASAASVAENLSVRLPRFDWERVGERRRGLLGSVGLSRWGADLVLQYEWDDRKVVSAQGGRSSFDRMNFIERLKLRTRGFVFDPRLVSFRVGGALGLFQEQFSSPGESGNNRGELLSFDVATSFLQGKPYSLNLFGTRTQDSVRQEFAGTKEVVLENLGGALRLDTPWLHSTINFRQEKSEEELRLGPTDTLREQRRRIASYTGSYVGTTSDVDINYEFQDVTDGVSPALSFQAHDGLLAHRIFFGPYLEKDLRSRARIFNRRGRFDTLSTRLEEALRIDHTDNFRTLYDYSYLHTDQDDSKTTNHLASAALQYKLYGSLQTSLRLSGNTSTLNEGETRGYDSSGSLRYTKRVAKRGTLNIGVIESYRIDEQDLKIGSVFVFQEPHIVKDFELIFLDNPRVAAETIFVTDADGTLVFDEGFDYRIVVIADQTALERLPSGRFADGATILVDYDFTSSRDLDFSTFAQSYDLSLDYGWIMFFLEYRENDQDLRSGADDTFLDDVVDKGAGMRLELAQSKRTASLSAEYRTHDSRRLSYRSPRFRQALSLALRRNLRLTLDLSESFFDFSQPERETSNLLGRLEVKWRPQRYLDMDFFTSYLQLDDSLAPDERFVDAGVRANLLFPKLRITPSFVATRRDVGRGRSTTLRARITVVREFP